MPLFEARMQHVKLTFSPFSADQMMTIGQVLLDKIVTRIKSAQDVTDSRARPLKPSYAEEKVRGRRVALGGPRKYTGLPFRDWTLRGRTLSACRVKFASQERVTIGPTSQETGMIMTARNRLDNMWGVSPSDQLVLNAVILETFKQAPPVRVERMGSGSKAA